MEDLISLLSKPLNGGYKKLENPNPYHLSSWAKYLGIDLKA
ncbi:hypothetical protein [Campylobacter troglodytis]|nr:hypothetical protein [Campylobacter troglodytis]